MDYSPANPSECIEHGPEADYRRPGDSVGRGPELAVVAEAGLIFVVTMAVGLFGFSFIDTGAAQGGVSPEAWERIATAAETLAAAATDGVGASHQIGGSAVMVVESPTAAASYYDGRFTHHIRTKSPEAHDGL